MSKAILLTALVVFVATILARATWDAGRVALRCYRELREIQSPPFLEPRDLWCFRVGCWCLNHWGMRHPRVAAVFVNCAVVSPLGDPSGPQISPVAPTPGGAALN